MKKILFIADARSIHSHKWIDYIAKKGNSKITWVSLNNSKYDLEKTINFIFIKSNFLIKSLKVFKIILFSRPHIIHLHYIGLHSLFLLFIRENSKLIINTWGSDLCFSERNFLRKYWLKNLLRKSHTVISDAYHHFEFLRKYGLEEKKFKYVPYGTDIEFFSSTTNSFSKQKYIVIHTRGLDDIYDVKTFIKAAKLVLKENKNFSFKVIGFGSKRYELEEYSRNLKINDRLLFLGQLSQIDLRNEINSADIYVSCSLRDGGIAGCTSEAMSCQRLVLITNNSDNHLWIKNGVNGYLFNNGDYKKLSQLILDSVKDKTKSKEIAKRARDKIVESNSYERQMDKVIKIYDSI